jgi:surface antigen
MRDDLVALRDRLVAYDPTINLDSVPRLQVMEAQLSYYDTQITATQNEIDDLNTQLHALQTRLDRVKPAAGADLAVIASMEQTQTPTWVQANTYDCVKHVVGKVSIPNGMAQDAHLWDDLVQRMSEYGITVGDVPLKGSVIVLEREHAYASNAYGHLLYVERVDSSGVWVTDNNHPDPIRLSDLTTETSGTNVKVLYFPWHTRA